MGNPGLAADPGLHKPIKLMNCKNCNCEACVNDRNRTDLKKHRLLLLNRMSWNSSPREAAKIILAEVAAGRGGSKKEWALEMESIFPMRDALAVLEHLGKLD